MAAKVSIDDLATAAEWLDVNEGDNGEAQACWRVAEMLRAEVERREQAATVRAVAKRTGVSPAAVRRKLREMDARA